MKTVFIRALKAEDKQTELRDVATAFRRGEPRDTLFCPDRRTGTSAACVALRHVWQESQTLCLPGFSHGQR